MQADGCSSALLVIDLDAGRLTDAAELHRELQRQLRLPAWYGGNWDALLDCLSSLDDPTDTLCRVCRGEHARSLVLRLSAWESSWLRRDSSQEFLSVVADANARLANRGAAVRVWVEFLGPLSQPDGVDWC